jgi:hypothetical protein
MGVTVHRFKVRPGATRCRIPGICLRRLRLRFATIVPIIGLGQGFRGSRLILFPDSIHEAYSSEKRADLSFPIRKLATHWQACGTASMSCEDFGASILPLSLTLNVEPRTCERLPMGFTRFAKDLKCPFL